MKPRTPTKSEIQTANDAIIHDGPQHTGELLRAITPTYEHWLKTILSLPKPATPDEIAHAAMTYGLNLGLRIGEVRLH